jgi:hypothetical protein
VKRKPYQPVLLREHIPTCYAIKEQIRGFWRTPWAYLERVEYRDALGRLRVNRGGKRWWYVRCNCSECPAAVLVCEERILGALPPGRIAKVKIKAEGK